MNEVSAERIRKGNRASLFGICCNLFLSASKIAVGLSTGLIALVADGANNLSDAAASTVSLIGFRLSARPADDEHPLGHARYEYISGLVVSFLVLLTGLELLKSSVEKILSPEDVTFSALTFIVPAVSILVKVVMALVYDRVGKQISSETILAAAQDSRNDCIATGAVLLSLIIMYYTGLRLDGVMGAAVSVFILYGGISLVRETIRPLLGTVPDPEFISHIEEKLEGYQGVLGAHDLMIHDYGPGHCFASVHVEVPGEQTVYECHELIDRIERDFLKDENIHLTIHYDPIMEGGKSGSPEARLHRYLMKRIRDLNVRISIHDVKISDNHVSFDCVIPPEDKEREHEIVTFLLNRVKDLNPDYMAAIKIDHGFVSME